MTGRPIDTEAMREQAKAALSYAEAKIGGAHEAYEWAARNAITLCDALDAARAENSKLRADLNLVAEEGTDEARCHESDGHQFSEQCRDIINDAYFRAREALGEEKQR